MVSDAGLNDFFKSEYGREIAEGDEFALSLWKRVLPQLQVAIKALGIERMPKVSQSDFDSVRDIILTEIPKLRREAAPADESMAHQVAQLFRQKK